MATVPNGIAEKLAYFETHMPIWTADPAAIGLTAQQLLTLGTMVQDARAAYNEAITARNTSLAATQNQTDLIALMSAFGGDIIKTIRAFAETTGDPGVYNAAQIPPPAPPAPLGPPETPTDLNGVLTTDGEIQFKWKGTRKGGTSYTISRSVTGANGPWTMIGTSEERSFSDIAVPLGLDSVMYRVRAARSGGFSQWSLPITFVFGTASASTSSSSGTGLTIAA